MLRKGGVFKKQAWLFAIVIIFTQAVLVAWSLYQEYQRTTSSEYSHLSDAARIADENISGSLRAIQILLRDVGEEVSRDKNFGAETLSNFMALHATAYPEVRTVISVDSKGIISSSTRKEIEGWDVHDRPYYADVLRDFGSRKTYISPLTIVKPTNVYAIIMSHATPAPDHSWAGVVSVTLELGKFHSLLASIRSDDGASAVALVGKDGTIISRAPEPEKFIGFSLEKGGVFERHITANEKQTFHRTTTLTDNIDKFVVIRTIASGSLYLVTAKPASEALKSWRSQLITQSMASVLLSIAVLIMTACAVRSANELTLSNEALVRHQNSLLERAEFTKAILNSVSPNIAIIDKSGIIIEVNAPWTTFGINNGMPHGRGGIGESYLGICQSAGSANPIAPAVADGILSVLSGNDPEFTLEYPCHSPDTERWFLMRVRALKGGQGGAVISHDDISNRILIERALNDALARSDETAHALAESEHFTRAVTDNLPGMVGYWDSGLRCKFANKHYLDWFGRSSQQMIGMTIQDLLGKSLFENNKQFILGVLSGVPQAFERTLVKPGGEVGHTWAQYIPDTDHVGTVKGFFVLVADITPIKDGELRLKEANDALTIAITRAEAANKAKSEFLASMSHEIRTPMNAILGLSEVLARTTLKPDQRECVDQVLQSGRSLLSILNDILDYSKVEAGRLELEAANFSLEEIFRSLAVILSINAKSKNIDIVIGSAPDVPTYLIGDGMRLQQVLINLAGNAIKFTDTGHIAVHVTMDMQHDQRVLLRFMVKDTGIGISEDTVSKLFAPFTQADNSTTRRYGGTGLGLAICRRLVDLMGGEIGVNSVDGQGSIFWFTAAFTVGTGPQEVRTCCSSDGLSVLVIDDNPESRTILCDTVAGLGWRCDSADSGEAALRQLAEGKKFDLVLVDWRMPGMDGMETARAIQTTHVSVNSPVIIMVTAFDRDEAASAPNASYVNGILVKPITASSLYDLVSRSCAAKAPLLSGSGSASVPPTSSNILNNLSILVVEDNTINQDVARRILELEGAWVEVVANGAEAVERLQENPSGYNIVLMDVQMPVMDGYEATRHIRTDLGLAKLPIIALTAGVMAADRQEALSAGMNDFISKPFDVTGLVLAVASHCGHENVPICELELISKKTDAIYDHNDLVARTGGKQSLIASILKRFKLITSTVVGQICKLIDDGDFEQAAQLMHTLRGTAGNIGAYRLSNCAAEYEAQLRTESVKIRSGDLDKLQYLISSTMHAIDALPDNHKFVEYPTSTEPTSLSGIATLMNLLAQNDVAAIDAFSRDMVWIKSFTDKATFEALSGAIENLEFSDALAIIKGADILGPN